MMADVHVLPGVERRDLAGAAVDSGLQNVGAIDEGVTDVIIVARDRKGGLYIAGAPPDVDRSVGMLMRAVTTLSSSDIVNDVVISGDLPEPA